MYDFEKHIEDADLIITGEGKLDSQSFMGKAVGGVIARSDGCPCVVLCGVNELDELPEGVVAVSASDGVGVDHSIENAAECLQKAIDGYFKDYIGK